MPVSLDKPDLRLLLEQLSEAGRTAAEALRKTGHPARRLSEALHTARARIPGTPEWRIAQQYPVFRCPFSDCVRTWDRTLIDDEEMRAQLWDHAHEHVPGESGHSLGGRWARSVLRRES